MAKRTSFFRLHLSRARRQAGNKVNSFSLPCMPTLCLVGFTFSGYLHFLRVICFKNLNANVAFSSSLLMKDT